MKRSDLPMPGTALQIVPANATGWKRQFCILSAILSGLAPVAHAQLDQGYLALAAPIAYQGLPESPIKTEPERNKGLALLVPRTQIKGVPSELLQKLGEQFAAAAQNPGLQLVTLADLNATTRESQSGEAAKGSLLDFSNNQSVLQEAVNRGIGRVLFVDVLHLNGKTSTVASQAVNLLSARAALTLLNAGDGVRVKSEEREVKVRGFDEADLTDKAFGLLARDLAQASRTWEIPEVQIRLAQVEVHALLEGIRVPVLRATPEAGGIEVTEVPVYAEGASVEVDGVLKGNAPCRVSLAPGTHKLRVYRDGAKDYTAQIQVAGGECYEALLAPTDETRRKFNEQLALFELAKNNSMFRQAAVERTGAVTEAIKKEADGQLQIDTATAKNIVPVRKAEAEGGKFWTDALRKSAPFFLAERLKIAFPILNR
jgi:hypothetical protein